MVTKKKKARKRYTTLERLSNRRLDDAGDLFLLAMRAAKNGRDPADAIRLGTEALDTVRKAVELRDRQTTIDEAPGAEE